MICSKIYKIDEKEKVRVWSMEVLDDSYRTVSGILDGKMVESGWIKAEGKNIGKKNETSPQKQAILTVERKYVEQLDQGGYYQTIEEATANKGVKFEPMLAQDYKKVKKKPGYPNYNQPKLDGLRCYIKSNLKGYSRNHKEWIVIPHITKEINGMGFFSRRPNAILDGELYNHKLKHEFEKIVSLTRQQKPGMEEFLEAEKLVEYHIFDFFDFDEPDLTFSERIRILQEEFSYTGGHCVVVETHIALTEQDVQETFSKYMEDGYEGLMIRTNEPYEMKRSNTLLKYKEFDDAEFEIVSVDEGKGNWAGAAKHLYIKLEDGTTQKSGMDGKYEKMAEVFQARDSYVGTMATIRYQGRTSDNKLRFPVCKFLWKGVDKA